LDRERLAQAIDGIKKKMGAITTMPRTRVKKSEFLRYKEMIPGREFEYADFVIYWTGWKQTYNQESIVGQWIAREKKGVYGYYISLPGMVAQEFSPGATFDVSYTCYESLALCIRSKSFRESIIKIGKEALLTFIDKTEAYKVMKALEDKDKVEDTYSFKWKGYRPPSLFMPAFTYSKAPTGVASNSVKPGEIVYYDPIKIDYAVRDDEQLKKLIDEYK
jgi:hypothetical protein